MIEKNPVNNCISTFEHTGQVLTGWKGNAYMEYESQNVEILHKKRKMNCKPVEEKAKSTQELKSLNFKSSNRKGTMRGKGKRKWFVSSVKIRN